MEDQFGRRGSFYAMALRERLDDFVRFKKNPKAQAFLLTESGRVNDEERLTDIVRASIQHSAFPVWGNDVALQWRGHHFTKRSTQRLVSEDTFEQEMQQCQKLFGAVSALPRQDHAQILAPLLFEGKMLYTPELLREAALRDVHAEYMRERIMEIFEAYPMWMHMYASRDS